MIYSVECPYCNHDNDMSDGLTDLPSDNKFDHECEKCEQEFEVFVEFEPSYYSMEIEYVNCEKCGTETRDAIIKGMTSPYPKNIKESKLCVRCYHQAMDEEYRKMYKLKVEE